MCGATVILDPHNQARYGNTVVGTGNVTNANFAYFWARLATRYKDNDKVVFGLVNEPHGTGAATTTRRQGRRNVRARSVDAWTNPPAAAFPVPRGACYGRGPCDGR